MNKTGAYIFLLVSFLLVAIILIVDHKNTKMIDKEMKENYGIEISGTVSQVSQNRGTIKLILNKKFNQPYYFYLTTNYKLNPYDLDDFLSVGDSVFKAKNSDDFYVFKENEKYHFVLGKSINKDYRQK